MIDLIKHEIFKLYKSRAVLLIICLTIGLNFMFAVSTAFIAQTPILPVRDSAGMLQILMIFALIVVCQMVAQEYPKGILRNLAMCGKSRIQIYLSKLIVAATFSLALFLLTFLIYSTVGIFCGFDTVPSVGMEVARFMLLMFGFVAFVSLAYFFSDLTKSTAATLGIAIGLLFLFQMIQLLAAVYAYIAPTAGDVLFFISKLYVGTSYTQIVYTEDWLNLAEFFAIAFVTLGAATGAGLYLFNKRDLK